MGDWAAQEARRQARIDASPYSVDDPVLPNEGCIVEGCELETVWRNPYTTLSTCAEHKVMWARQDRAPYERMLQEYIDIETKRQLEDENDAGCEVCGEKPTIKAEGYKVCESHVRELV